MTRVGHDKDAAPRGAHAAAELRAWVADVRDLSDSGTLTGRIQDVDHRRSGAVGLTMAGVHDLADHII